MVRRRSASPRASGPVRSMPMRSAPAPVPVTRPAAAPARTPLSSASPPPAGGATRQPGLLGQMAATAGGVAIGSAVVCICVLLQFLQSEGTLMRLPLNF